MSGALAGPATTIDLSLAYSDSSDGCTEGNVLELIAYPGNATTIHDLRGRVSAATAGSR